MLLYADQREYRDEMTVGPEIASCEGCLSWHEFVYEFSHEGVVLFARCGIARLAA